MVHPVHLDSAQPYRTSSIHINHPSRTMARCILISYVSCLTFIFFLQFTGAKASKCKRVKDAAYYLALPDKELLAVAASKSRVGKCYLLRTSLSDAAACDLYVKSALVGNNGDRGWPKSIYNTGTGCVRAPSRPRRVQICYYTSSDYDIPSSTAESFCTDDGDLNAAAMLRHAIRNNA